MSEPLQIPQLVEVAGPHAGRLHPLPYGEHVIGRAGRVSVRLDHEDVSRRHARLEVSPDGVVVHDLGSKNGVRVAGERLRAPAVLELRIIHPASQVTRALAAGGEVTATTDVPPPEPRPDLRGLLLPLVGVIVCGVLVAVMLLQ
jgi:S-DNA-T family DNA segregation ATPase FtsK/SpoIIIE